MMQINYKQKTILLIVIAAIVKIVVSATINLGNDEVYYRMYAQELQWNYFDHPPMVAWLTRLTTFNLHIDTPFFIRLGAILSSALVTWLYFLCGKKIVNSKTGFFAAAIYTATIYGSIISGMFILPDSPQMVFWLIGTMLLLDIVNKDDITHQKKIKILYFGVIVGLGMMCKVHTIFLWIGFLLYIVFYNRNWLKQPTLYFAGVISLIIFSPVIMWNVNNGFVTYFFHSKRIDVASGGIDVSNFIKFIFAQLLYCNPILIFYFGKASLAGFKGNLPILNRQIQMLLLISLPLIIVAIGISLFKEVLPHWIGPSYTSLILLCASLFTKKEKINTKNKLLPKPILAGLLVLFFIITTATALINFYPGTIGSKNSANYGDGDFTLDMYGWEKSKSDFENIFLNDAKTGLMKTDATIISNKWFPASHIDYYLAIPLKRNIQVIGDTNDIHQYIWLNKKRRKLKTGDDAYFIAPSNNNCNVIEMYKSYFETIIQPDTIIQKRSGVMCRKFYVWRLKNYIAN